MNIAIIGFGNVGTQFAVMCALQGHKVNVFSTKPERVSKHLQIVDKKGAVIHEADINLVSNDYGVVLDGVELIFVTRPASVLKKTAEELWPYMKKEMKIGFLPGTGGDEFYFSQFLTKGVILFGIQRVPAVARLKEYGKSVYVVGPRKTLYLASLPTEYNNELCNFMTSILHIECIPLPNYLCVTLTPSNPILHTTRLFNLFGDYTEGRIYPRQILFYEEWDNESSELLLACDNELQNICKALDDFDLTSVKSLRVHYESNTSEELTQKIQSIEAFQGLPSPMKPVEGGFIPNFDSRYFSSDFPFGLSIIMQMGELCKVEIPNIIKTYNWYASLENSIPGIDLKDFGIKTKQDLINFYNSVIHDKLK